MRSAVASVVPLATQITELHHKTTVRFRAFTSLYDISSFRRACILRSCATKALESPPTPPTAPTQLAHAPPGPRSPPPPRMGKATGSRLSKKPNRDGSMSAPFKRTSKAEKQAQK